MYDIAIVGAGPAGATLARLVGKNYRVLLIDKRQFEKETGSIQKSCGGLLAPDAQKVLAGLGLGVPKEVLVGPQLFAVRTIDLESSIERYYQRHYINIDREKFDKWLVSQVPDCVEKKFGCMFKSFERKEGKFELKFTADGKEFTEFAKIVIGADGSNSLVRKHAFPNCNIPKQYISIQEWYNVGKEIPYFSAIFDSNITDFYSWTIQKEGFMIIGSALEPRYNTSEKFEDLKKKLRNWGYEFDNCVRREGAFISRPSSISETFIGSDDIALVGEAGGWISPSSAEGMSYAFKSAIALSDSIKEDLIGFVERYSKNMSGLRKNILIKKLKSPFMYNSLMRKLVMKSGIESIQPYR